MNDYDKEQDNKQQYEDDAKEIEADTDDLPSDDDSDFNQAMRELIVQLSQSIAISRSAKERLEKLLE